MLAASRPIMLALPLIALMAIIVLFFGIRDDPDAQKIAARMSDTHTVRLIGGERPAALALPRVFDPQRSYLLILGLHGYDSNAWEYDQYLRLSPAVNTDDIALLLPQGLKDSGGSRFWNGVPWRGAPQRSGVDDVAWLKALIVEADEIVQIERVVAVGHSNGGFMAYRLACEGVPNLSAIISLAGSSFADPQRCAEAALVSVLQIHGDEDDLVLYEGEAGEDGYPGAEALARRWAERAGCDPDAPAELPPLDLDGDIDGAETAARRWSAGCDGDAVVELWSIHGGGHAPDFSDAFAPRILAWLDAAN